MEKPKTVLITAISSAKEWLTEPALPEELFVRLELCIEEAEAALKKDDSMLIAATSKRLETVASDASSISLAIVQEPQRSGGPVVLP